MITASHIMTPDTRSIDWRQPVNWRDPLNDGLVSWWMAIPNHTSGTSTWRDLCGLNDGTLANFANVDQAWKTQGQPGGFGALEFDGTNDYGDINTVASGSLASDRTLLCWFRASAMPADRMEMIYTGSQSVTTGKTMSLEVKKDGANYYVGTWIYNRPNYHATTALATGRWYMGVVLYRSQADTIEIYTDGTLESSDTGALVAGDWEEAAIGVSTDDSPFRFYFDGDISDVRIWNRALTASEIQDYYHRSQRFYPGLLTRHTRRSVFVPSTGTTITPATLSMSAALQGSPPVSSRTIEVT